MRTTTKMWHLYRILRDYRAGREVVRPLPIRMWVEAAARCNLRCVMCPNKDMPAGEKGLMPLDLFKKIVDQAAGQVHDIYLHHRGEPLLNPALFDMIRYAREHDIRTRFHSNGTLLDEERARRLLADPPDLISFSIDGFEQETYERIRVGARFERTLENVFRLLEMRREARARKPYVVIEKIAFRNRPERPSVRLAAQALRRRFYAAGADEVIEKEEYDWAEERAPEQACAARTYSKCTFAWYSMVVCYDGTVTPCPQDFWAKLRMGNVKSESLADIWNGDAYRALRRGFLTDVSSLPLCRTCDRLCRKTVGGLPLQYMVTFLTDHLVGYNRLRRMLGTAERNR